MLIGFALFLGFWYLSVEVWKLPRFARNARADHRCLGMAQQGSHLWALDLREEYYLHIWVSTRRISIAFFLATAIGVPLGLFLGWSRRFKQYVFPVFELLRPIPRSPGCRSPS